MPFKGQQDVLSAILISGVLIAVVSSVYFWGVPLIQKNRDIATLRSSEDFIYSLNNKIKFIANNGGKDQLIIDVPGIITVENGQVRLKVDTQGTIYAVNAQIPLSRNDCTRTTGTWGVHDSTVLCVRSNKITDNRFTTFYDLDYIKLDVTDQGQVLRSFEIELVGRATGGQDRKISIENAGIEEGDNTKTKILLSIL